MKESTVKKGLVAMGAIALIYIIGPKKVLEEVVTSLLVVGTVKALGDYLGSEE